MSRRPDGERTYPRRLGKGESAGGLLPKHQVGKRGKETHSGSKVQRVERKGYAKPNPRKKSLGRGGFSGNDGTEKALKKGRTKDPYGLQGAKRETLVVRNRADYGKSAKVTSSKRSPSRSAGRKRSRTGSSRHVGGSLRKRRGRCLGG